MAHVQISIAATAQQQEELIALLCSFNPTGFEQTETNLLAYFDETNFESYEVHHVLKKHPFTSNTIPEQNWNNDWEKTFEPVLVADFCAVRAYFHKPIDKVRHQIIITPKMSFGTGHHATTYMMIEHMKSINFSNRKVLDFGTGTGILAILAEKLGASNITAIDNDEWSIRNAEENIQINNCTKIKLDLTSEIKDTSYNIILANLTKNVILEQSFLLTHSLVPDGIMLLSGLLAEDENEIVAVFSRVGYSVVEKKEMNDWISLLFSTTSAQLY